MKRPTAALVLVAFATVVASAACGADDPRTPASASVSDPQAFVCQTSVRPSVQEQPEPLEEIRMSEPGDRSTSSGAFRFRVLYSNDGYESPSLNTYVYSTSTKKLIEHSLFQFDPEEDPVNQFTGGHGFTGLHYVRAPDSAAELQYVCTHG